MKTKKVMQPKSVTSPALPADAATPYWAQTPLDKGRNQLFTIEEIQVRAEVVTPLLRSILEAHPPTHWGNN